MTTRLSDALMAAEKRAVAIETKELERLIAVVDRSWRTGHAATVPRVAARVNERGEAGQARVETMLDRLVAENRLERFIRLDEPPTDESALVTYRRPPGQ